MAQEIQQENYWERKKRREKERWAKVILYYLWQKYAEEKVKVEEQYSANIRALLGRDLQERKLSAKQLMEKKPGELSCYEILEHLEKLSMDKDNPLMGLLGALRKSPPEDAEVTRAAAECVEKMPAQIIAEDGAELERRRKLHMEPDKLDEKAMTHEEKLTFEMTAMRALMPPELFRELCKVMMEQGRKLDPNKDYMRINEPMQEQKKTRSEYLRDKTYHPNEDYVRAYTTEDMIRSAAAALAAYEQKDEQEFDANRANARAREMAGSRAFRQYMKSHSKMLIATAQNEGVEYTHHAIEALELDLKRRDAVLRDACGQLKSMASGKSSQFHKMVNMLSRYMEPGQERNKQERQELTMALVEFVQKDCVPGKPEYNKTCFTQSMCALRALSNEDDFARFVGNLKETGYGDLKTEMFPLDVAPKKTLDSQPPQPDLTRKP